MDPASAWRMGVARRISGAVSSHTGAVAVAVTGSTARGRADRFSDLDLLVLWQRQPQIEERLQVISASGGEIIRLYDYDPAHVCWSDAYTLGRDASGKKHTGLSVDVAHLLVPDVKRAILALVRDRVTDEPHHDIGKLVKFSEPVYGHAVIQALQASLQYPEELAVAMVQREGQLDYFWRWKSALARGHNDMLIQHHFATFAQKLLRTLLALNRTYCFGFGCLPEVFERLHIQPRDFEARFRALWSLSAAETAAALSALIEETFDLIEAHLPAANVEQLRAWFRYERTPWDADPAEPRADVTGG